MKDSTKAHKPRSSIKYLIVVSLALIAATYLFPSVTFASTKNCLACHAMSGFAETIDGKKISLKINTEGYNNSVHGNIDCENCHPGFTAGPHGKSAASNYKKVASFACAKCHKQAFKDYTKSPHGKGYLKGESRVPTCTRCHGNHYIALIRDDKAASYYLNAPKELCGHCHEHAFETYLESYHGKTLIALDYNKTPGCPQCHNPHKADKLDTPKKQIAACKQCHKNANKNFVGYDVHANENDRIKEPVLFYSKWSMTFLLLGTFAFFYPHSVLWAIREKIEARRAKQKELKQSDD